MIDPGIERRFFDCRELLELWHRFHGYFGLAVKGDVKLLTHDREAEFLRLKSRIAMLHDSFMESLKHDAEIGQHILTIIERSITLKHLSRISIAEIKKMEIEWHESYLLLSETVASLEERRSILAKVNPTKYKFDKLRMGVIANVKAFVGGLYFKLFLILLCVPVLLVIVNQFWSFSNLKNIRATRDFYYSAANIYRKTIGPGLPYERFEDISRDVKQRPEDLESDQSSYNHQTAASMDIFRNAGIDRILSESRVSFKEETFKIQKTYDKLSILMFMIKGEDGNDVAEQCVWDVKKWLDSLPPQTKEMYLKRYDVFNKNNVFIAINSQSESNRKAVKEMEFGIRD